MWNDRYLSFDVETSGFGSTARILEVAVVCFEKGVPIEEWSSLLSPEDLNWEDEKVMKALEVNHITKEACSGQPSFRDIVPVLHEWLKEPVWVAHGRDFDTRMLKQEFTREGYIFGFEPKLSICTMELSRHLQGHIHGHKLEDVALRWEVEFPEKHRALHDAKVCGLVLHKMSERGVLPPDDSVMESIVRSAVGARGPRRDK